MEFMELKE